MIRFRGSTVTTASTGRGPTRTFSSLSRAASQSSARVRHVRVVQKSKRIEVKRAIYRSFHFRYIYIGNLPANVTEKQLTAFCDRAGEVSRVIVRSTSGNVCFTQASGSTPPSESRLYASVEFKSSFAAGRALQLDGTMFFTSRVVVTQDALKLPEFQDIERKCREMSAQVESPKTVPSAMQSQWNTLKRITVDRTQVVPLDYAAGGASRGYYQQLLQPAPRKQRLMGYSIANTIA